MAEYGRAPSGKKDVAGPRGFVVTVLTILALVLAIYSCTRRSPNEIYLSCLLSGTKTEIGVFKAREEKVKPTRFEVAINKKEKIFAIDGNYYPLREQEDQYVASEREAENDVGSLEAKTWTLVASINRETLLMNYYQSYVVNQEVVTSWSSVDLSGSCAVTQKPKNPRVKI